MKKLNHILHSKWFYILVVFLTITYSIFYLNLPHHSKLDMSKNYLKGIITNIKIEGDLLTLEIKEKETIIGTYYFQTEEEKNTFINQYQLGDMILVTGSFSRSKNNTVPNLFNYRKYLERKGIYYLMSIESIEKQKSNQNIFYAIKTKIQKHIDTYQSKDYLNAFILGSNELLDKDMKTTYQEIGVSHLLAISGMHVSLLSGILLLLLKKVTKKEKLSYIVTILFLVFYMFLSGKTPSVSRAVVLFSLLTANKILKWNLKTLQIWCLTFSILVFQNPNLILEVGFQFSFIVSFYLILLQSKLKNKSYFHSLMLVSIISFLVSFPITIFNFYQVNCLSILFNLIFVPLVSMLIFPLALLTFFIPLLDPILSFFIHFMEQLAIFCNHFAWSKIIWMKPSLIWIILYYIVITICFYQKKKLIKIIFVFLLGYQYFQLVLFPRSYFIMIDVGQGDSLLIHSNNQTMLIDTGGKMSYQKEEWQQRKVTSLSESTLIPLLKSLGIRKLDYLVLSHGDYDHMGEATNLVNNFKVEKVVFNHGEYNELESELIEVLDKKNIQYNQNIKELNISGNKFYFLNDKLYDNENDNSNIIYTELYGTKLLLMGDAGVEVENDILKKYNLYDIDILKVGHHGSKTSSNKEFINSVHPNYSIISVGKNNRYGHPNENVLENLDTSTIYRTDQDGSILFKIQNNKLKIETFSP